MALRFLFLLGAAAAAPEEAVAAPPAALPGADAALRQVACRGDFRGDTAESLAFGVAMPSAAGVTITTAPPSSVAL
jgi:hypothetical protein